MKKSVLIAAVTAMALLTGCATKNYPMQGYMTRGESQVLTCRELYLKQVEAEGVQAKIQDQANLNWRSAAAFLTDFGIGNVMARNDADKAVMQRILEIRGAQSEKGCQGSYVDQTAWHDVPTKKR